MHTIQELATATKVCTKTVHTWIKDKKVKAVKVGRQIRITNEEFVRVLREGV